MNLTTMLRFSATAVVHVPNLIRPKKLKSPKRKARYMFREMRRSASMIQGDRQASLPTAHVNVKLTNIKNSKSVLSTL